MPRLSQPRQSSARRVRLPVEFLLVHIGLSPLAALTAGLKKLRAGDLQILEGDYPSEITPIVDELNALVHSGRESLQKARGQVGRLAHGLKTPLAVVNDEAYRLGELSRSEAAKATSDKCRAMQIQIDQHIARSRASVMSRLPGVKCNGLSVVGEVLKALSRLHTDRNIEADVDMQEDMEIPLDATDFGELLGCVIDNAFKHARQRLGVSEGLCGSHHISIHADDDGEGLEPESREYVFQTGVRLDSTVNESGLGLAKVKEILELYGASCRFDDCELGGARFTIILPL
tara:strand:- start:24973 stop:25836 length:864 start_codon:yes stop_codon:yes gene_type:complete